MRDQFEWSDPQPTPETPLDEHVRLLNMYRRTDTLPAAEALNDSSQLPPRIKKRGLGEVPSLVDRVAHHIRAGTISPRCPDDTF